MKYVFGAVSAVLVYEILREALARNLRTNTPPILRRELANRSPAAGLLAPVLGTVAVSEAAGVIVEQTLLDTLPTLIGRKRAPGIDQ